MMKKPKMILFDYGQTLVNEERFDGIKGTGAVLAHAGKNKYSLTAEQVQAEADAINNGLGRFDPKKKHLFQIEIPSQMFSKYLYESLGISIDLSPVEIDRIFWDAASPGRQTDGIFTLSEGTGYSNRRDQQHHILPKSRSRAYQSPDSGK